MTVSEKWHLANFDKQTNLLEGIFKVLLERWLSKKTVEIKIMNNLMFFFHQLGEGG